MPLKYSYCVLKIDTPHRKMRLLAFVALLTFCSSIKAKVVTISIYYEALCPDSREFIINVLSPGHLLFREYMDLDFIPYGNAKITNSSDGTLTFTCEHGPEECYSNEVQGCAISLKPESSMTFVRCAMDSEDPSDDALLENCAMYGAISWDDIKECMSNGQAEEIFVKNGARTEAMHITRVPTIVFNGVHNETLQDLAEHNFMKTICELLDREPQLCRTM